MSRLQPQVSGLSSEFFDGCNKGVLRLQQCKSCRTIQFYPRVFCKVCSGRNLEWVNASGKGKVASFTVVRKALTEVYKAPYIEALIDLKEGPRMMSNIVNCEPELVSVEADVEVVFSAWSDTLSLPVFELSNEK